MAAVGLTDFCPSVTGQPSHGVPLCHIEMKHFYSRSKELLLLLASEFPLLAKNIGKTADQYSRINGEQCAASFAYYAFFLLFPLILLLGVLGTFFIPDRILAARQVVEEVEQMVPLHIGSLRQE